MRQAKADTGVTPQRKEQPTETHTVKNFDRRNGDGGNWSSLQANIFVRGSSRRRPPRTKIVRCFQIHLLIEPPRRTTIEAEQVSRHADFNLLTDFNTMVK